MDYRQNPEKIKKYINDCLFNFEKHVTSDEALKEITLQSGIKAIQAISGMERSFIDVNTTLMTMMCVDMKNDNHALLEFEVPGAILQIIKNEVSFLEALIAEIEFRQTTERTN